MGSDEGPDGGKIRFQSVLDLQPTCNLAAAMKDRGVVSATEQAPDLGKRLAPIVAEQIHCNLASAGSAGVCSSAAKLLTVVSVSGCIGPRISSPTASTHRYSGSASL